MKQKEKIMIAGSMSFGFVYVAVPRCNMTSLTL
jgi:hypothetical protein